MFPFLYEFELPSFPEIQGLPTYGTLLILGFAAAWWIASRRAQKVGYNPDLLLPILAIAVVLGILGARLLHFLGSDPGGLLKDPLLLFKLNQGGMAFLGGAICASVGCLWFAKRRGVHLWKFADATAPTILVGLAVGRLGCFTAGCCHGREPGYTLPNLDTLLSLPGGDVLVSSSFPWVFLSFNPGVGVGKIHDTPVFPSQVWESLGALAVFAFLTWMWKKRRRFDGQILAWMLLLYPALRATLERFRGDTLRGVEHFGLLSTSQVVSIPLAVLGVALLAYRARFGLAPEKAWEPEEVDILL